MEEEAARDKETVKVVVRCRPLFGKEVVEGRKSIVSIDPAGALISIKCPENDQLKSFTFDAVYDENTSQRQFYDESGYPLVESIFEGYNGTIFAYGQTGCGKTHTMQGKDSPPELRGVIPHSFDHIFDTIKADPSREYMVRASYLEIYNEDIRDLLGDDSKKKLDLKEAADGSVYVKELTEVVVGDVDSMNRVMNRGFKNRTIGATLMNEGSSRSHSIFTVVVETSEKIDNEEHFKAGKLNLVDLAGSERQSKTGATGNRLKEGCKINLSLSALGNVISALVDGKGKHIPYRDSKLTRLLQDSLGGNTKTLMVAAVSPADYNYDETLSTLRYANRAKNIKNKPVVNEDPKDAKLREYKEEIERLKKLLESQSRGSAMGSASGMSTPIRPLSSNSIEPTPRELNSRGEMMDSATLAKEREEIAKYQQEAAAMLEQAKRMMDEARALQAQQLQNEQTLQAATELSPSSVASDKEASLPEELKAKVPLSVNPPIQSTIDDSDGPSSGRPRRPSRLAGSLPPLGSSLASSSESTPKQELEIIEPQPTMHSRLPEQQPLESSISSQLSEFNLKQKPSSSELAAKAEEDAKIAKALWNAAQIDKQAKEMMAKAQNMMEAAELRAKEAKKVKIVKEVVVKEVIPDHHVREKEELREMNQSILDQRDRIGKELERTQEAMEAFLREKEELRNKLKKIESHILGGSSARRIGETSSAVDSEIALLKQQVEYRRTQLKLKEKAKREARHEMERKALVIEKQQMEEELKTAQETAQAALATAKRKEAKHRAKLEALRQEIADLNNEFERERENLLDTIREQTKESKLLEQLIEVFLPQNELVKVWERAVWSEEREEWTLPKLKPRSDFQKIKLPTLGFGGGAGPLSNGDGVESGGAEVVSDEENIGAGPATQSSNGGASSRAAMSGSRQQQRRNLIPRAPAITQNTGGSTSKPSSSNEGSLSTTRGMPDPTAPRSSPSSVATAPLRGILPLENTRLPNPLNSSRNESFGIGSSSGRNHNSSDGTRHDHKRDGDDDSISLLLSSGISGEYQPRDRLQSRQGSRQGSRQERVRPNATLPADIGNGFDEFDARSAVPNGNKLASTNGSRVDGQRHHRHHRDRREGSPQSEESTLLLPTVDSTSPDSKVRASKREKKKKKDRREKHDDAVVTTSIDPEGGKERSSGGTTSSGRRGSHRSPPNDQDDLYEDW